MVLFKSLSIPRTAVLAKILQKSWTIWSNSAKVKHSHGIDRVLQASSRCHAGEGAFLEFSKDCDTVEFRSMAPFSTSRYSMDSISREGDRQLFSMTLGIAPLSGRAADAAFAREGK
jgi:hypothetical protein